MNIAAASATRLLLATSLALMIVQPAAQAESLFRAQASVTEEAQFVPRSLFTSPRAAQVGDIVTIKLNEIQNQQINATLRSQRKNENNETGSTVLNNAVRSVVGKIPFVNGRTAQGISRLLSVPSMDGIQNESQLTSATQAVKQTRLNDSISCQVVQVLPNGYLVVQGHKLSTMSKEQTDMFITGVVNPFYINRNNEIDSNRVANLQVMVGGKGVVSRNQSDGVISKVQQFFN
jgi:flagellar L-ring protein precursor FlgH